MNFANKPPGSWYEPNPRSCLHSIVGTRTIWEKNNSMETTTCPKTKNTSSHYQNAPDSRVGIYLRPSNCHLGTIMLGFQKVVRVNITWACSSTRASRTDLIQKNQRTRTRTGMTSNSRWTQVQSRLTKEKYFQSKIVILEFEVISFYEQQSFCFDFAYLLFCLSNSNRDGARQSSNRKNQAELEPRILHSRAKRSLQFDKLDSLCEF